MAKKKKPTQEMMTTMRVSHFLDPYQEYWTYGMLGLEILEQFVQPPDPCLKLRTGQSMRNSLVSQRRKHLNTGHTDSDIIKSKCVGIKCLKNELPTSVKKLLG